MFGLGAPSYEEDFQPEVLHYPDYEVDEEENYEINGSLDESMIKVPTVNEINAQEAEKQLRHKVESNYSVDPNQKRERRSTPRHHSRRSSRSDNQRFPSPKLSGTDSSLQRDTARGVTNKGKSFNTFEVDKQATELNHEENLTAHVSAMNNTHYSEAYKDHHSMPNPTVPSQASPAEEKTSQSKRNNIAAPPIQDETRPIDHLFTEYQPFSPLEVLHYTYSCNEEDTRYSIFYTLHGVISWFYWGFNGTIREGIEITSHRVRKQRTEKFGPHILNSEMEELLCNLQHISMEKRVLPRKWFDLIDNVFLRLIAIIFMHTPFVLTCVNTLIAILVIFHYVGLIVYSTLQLVICALMIIQLIACIILLWMMNSNDVHISIYRFLLFVGLYSISLIFGTLAFILSFITLVPNGNVAVGIIVLLLTYISTSFHFLALIHNPHFRQEYLCQVTLHFSPTQSEGDTPDNSWNHQAQLQKFKDYALVGCICGGGIGIFWTLLWFFLQKQSLKSHHNSYEGRTLEVFMNEKSAQEMIHKIWRLRDDIRTTGYELFSTEELY